MSDRINRQYLPPILALLLIPVVSIAGGALFGAIDPEIAARHPDYVRNYRLIDAARHGLMYAILLADVALWFATCALLLKAKRRTLQWLPLALLGPFGFAVIAALRDLSPEPRDLYDRLTRRLNVWLLVAYEVCAFMVLLEVAYELMLAKRSLMVWYEAATTGISQAQIIDQQNAESGMRAFGEGTETMYLLALLYLLRPVLVDVAGALFRGRSSRARGGETNRGL